MNALVLNLVYIIPAILLALTIHEFAHGYVSYRLGDPTPKRDGRLSLNPLVHLDPMGTLFLIMFRFGWAKPVQVMPQYYKDPKKGMALVAIAGPAANLVLALVAIVVMNVMQKTTTHVTTAHAYIYTFFDILAMINMGLAIFNLLPIPPLDGSKVLGAVLPTNLYFSYMRYEQYGMIILMLLLFTNVLMGPLQLMRGAIDTWLWYLADLLTFFL